MTKPEITFKAGAVRASVFRNTIQRDGQAIPLRKVVLEVRYRDKDAYPHGATDGDSDDPAVTYYAAQRDSGPYPDHDRQPDADRSDYRAASPDGHAARHPDVYAVSIHYAEFDQHLDR